MDNELERYNDKEIDTILSQEVEMLKTGGQTFDIEPVIIEIMHGHELFKMNDADESTPTQLECVLMDSIKYRSLFEFADQEEATCKSIGCVVGKPNAEMVKKSGFKEYFNKYEARCAECPAAQWGSAGAGQACRDKRNMMILPRDIGIPHLLRAPTMSIKNHDNYWRKLINGNKHPCAVWTRLTLTHDSRGSQEWSVLNFEYIGDVERELLSDILSFKKKYGASTKNIEENSPAKAAAEKNIPEISADKDDDIPF